MDKMNLLLRGLRIDWEEISEDSYLRKIPAIAGLWEMEFDGAVTFFVGENGSGKSTLLEAIAVSYGFNPEGGTKNYRFSTYDSHSELCRAMTLVKGVGKPGWGYFLRAESFYNVATAEDRYSREGGGMPQFYHERSHGESFLALAQSQFRGRGLYLLDEPEAALSPQRQLTLLCEIARSVKEGAQFVIATHSPILLGIPGARILSFDYGAIHPVEYEETECYQVTKLFIENKDQMLKRLLEDRTEAEDEPGYKAPAAGSRKKGGSIMRSLSIRTISVTKLDTDAVVNAANSALRQGTGVCGAIFRDAGAGEMTAACRKIGHCDEGSAVITPGFRLQAKYVIHAVGPIWSGGSRKEPELLYSAYKTSLALAMEHDLHSVGFPLLSAGVFGYPLDGAWRQALTACRDFFRENPEYEMDIVFAVLDDGIKAVGERMADEMGVFED